MKISKLTSVLSLCTLILAVGNNETYGGSAPTQGPLPLTGNGISQAPLKPLQVSLALAPASNDGINPQTLGTFFVETGRAPLSQGTRVVLSIYRLFDNGGEKLVATVEMDGMAQILGGPDGFRPPAFFASLSDPKKFPVPLEAGYYRAESIVYSLAPAIITGGRVSDPAWVEAGGAAVDFSVNPVNLLPVDRAAGGLSVTATITPRRGATSAQISQLNTEAQARVAKIFAGAKTIFDGQSAIGKSEPTRLPWQVQVSHARSGLSSSLTITSGQSFRHLVPQITSSLGSVVKNGTYSVSLPGGSITLRTFSGVQFSR